jgi:hypothetical protein
MPRKRVSKGTLIPNKEKKLAEVFALLKEENNYEEFKELFINMFPNEWERIIKRYKEHKEINKGNAGPMPEPNKYLINVYNNYKKKLNQ